MREHVGFAGVRNDRVLLLVESSAWATRVRMEQSRILAAVQSMGLAASSVTAKVVPMRAPVDGSAAPPSLTPRAAQTIRAAASAIADPDLRALFLDLAALAKGPPAE